MPLRGYISDYWEQGWEGDYWLLFHDAAFTHDGLWSMEGAYRIQTGDRLTIYEPTGEVRWSGILPAAPPAGAGPAACAVPCGMNGLPASYLSARITRREDHTDDLATFWLRPERPVAFQPGQYVTLALPGASGRLVKRPYSVLSAPHEDEIELFIERVEGGELTPSLFERGAGDAVGVRRRAAGAFARDAACTHHVMACTVTGVAPFLSMLRDAAASGEHTGDRFLVLYGASGPADLGPYADELAAVARGEHLTAVATVSRPWAAPDWGGETGRVEDVLRKHLDARGWPLALTAGYACGNPVMVENVHGVLRRAGLDEAHLHEEAYFPDSGETAPAEAPPAAPPARRQGPPVGPPGGVVLKTAPRPPNE